MAISLSQLKAPAKRELIVTVCGEAGTGKTSLAASFPKPVFLSVESGLSALMHADSEKELLKDVVELDVSERSEDVFDAIKALATEDHEHKTLVIDSVTALNTLFEHEIIDSDPKKPASLNQAHGGYGCGYNMLSDKHRKLREWVGRLSTKKCMTIVFIAHSAIETVDTPENEPYMRTTLALHAKSLKHYVDNVDVVAYARLKLRTKNTSSGKSKAVTSGDRELVCHLQGGCVSKNRLGITEPLPLEIGINPLQKYL